MTLTIRTFSSQFNARRGAERSGLDVATLDFFRDQAGKWTWRNTASAIVAKAESLGLVVSPAVEQHTTAERIGSVTPPVDADDLGADGGPIPATATPHNRNLAKRDPEAARKLRVIHSEVLDRPRRIVPMQDVTRFEGASPRLQVVTTKPAAPKAVAAPKAPRAAGTARATSGVPTSAPKAGTKGATILAMISARDGATEQAICDAIGWPKGCRVTLLRAAAAAGLTVRHDGGKGMARRFWGEK